jgi:hypothetical protein
MKLINVQCRYFGNILDGQYKIRISLIFSKINEMNGQTEYKYPDLQWYAPIKIIGIKISVPIKREKSLRLMVHISKTLTQSLR